MAAMARALPYGEAGETTEAVLMMIYYHIKPTHVRGGHLTLAKLTPFLTGDAITEPGDVWFEFGTPAESMGKLRAEIESWKQSQLN